VTTQGLETIGNPTNGAACTIELSAPYTASVTVQGAADLLFHAWNVESVEAKGKAAKGSKAKKSDDVESYVYRNEAGEICIPGEYLRMSLAFAAKYIQDPRSPRKSAMDLFKAGVAVLTPLASLGCKDWDYLDRRRVSVQRNGITRTRPAFKAGWKAEFVVQVLLPEYIDQSLLQTALMNAGRLVGLGDFRPTFGRFNVVNFQVVS
jgi:hypothetical protein